MNVCDVLRSATMAASVEAGEIEVSGWMVVIGDDLYILDEDFPEDYRRAPKLRVVERDVIYAVRRAILPLGGGESFVFHRVRVIGQLRVEIDPEITVSSLFIQERGSDDFISVDVTAESVKADKARYEAALNFDFFKEMGDT